MATSVDYSILPIAPDDTSSVARMLCDAKITLSINRFLFKDWPNPAAQWENYSNAIKSGFGNPDRDSVKVVDNKTGDIVGHFVTTHQKPEEKQLEPAKKDADYLVPEILTLVMDAVKGLQKGVEGIEHIALTHIYVKPSNREQGIGSTLVKRGLERAKKEGLPVFLISEPQAREFFLSKGFLETGYVDIDLSRHAPPNCGYGIFRLTSMIFENK